MKYIIPILIIVMIGIVTYYYTFSLRFNNKEVVRFSSCYELSFSKMCECFSLTHDDSVNNLMSIAGVFENEKEQLAIFKHEIPISHEYEYFLLDYASCELKKISRYDTIYSYNKNISIEDLPFEKAKNYFNKNSQ